MNAFDRLGRTLQAQMNNAVNDGKSILIEYGTITTDFGLKIARFDTVIPKGEYLIDKRLSIDYKPEIEVVTSLTDGHSHTVKIPITEGIERIKAGDRVLVCWIDVDPIVVAVIVSSSDIGRES